MTNYEQRFWSKVDQRGPDECWEWKAGTDKDGYGVYAINRKYVRANRVAYEFATGEKILGEPTIFILHSCDNPPCCNPAHLRKGTPWDNAQDAVLRGRNVSGEVHGRAKLNVATVIELRRSVESGEKSVRQWAKDLGMGHKTLYDAVTGVNWAHVPGAVKLQKRIRFDTEIVRTIRETVAGGQRTQRDWADEMNVTPQYISWICTRRIWKNA